MWSVANSLELRGPKGWWLMRPNIAAALCCYGSSTPVFDKNTNHNTTVPWQTSRFYPLVSNFPRLRREFLELSQFSAEAPLKLLLLWSELPPRVAGEPILFFFFGSKVGKLEKGGILRLLSSSTKARQLSSWRREPRKGEKKKKKRDETTGDFIEENVKLLINLICWCCCRRGCTVGKITWNSSFVI